MLAEITLFACTMMDYMDKIWLSLTFSDVYLLDRGDILENEITET